MLDQAIVSYTGYASAERFSALHPVMNVIRDSEAYQHLLLTTSNGLSFMDRLAQRRAVYWLTPEELWARAYAQYIAARSNNAALLQEVEIARTLETHPASSYVQWQNADFAAIDQAMDSALDELGWEMMNPNNPLYLLIEQNLQNFADRGVSRKAGDVEACLRYRNGLSPADQQIFDGLVREGTFAGSAAEIVEMLAGREQPRGNRQEPVGAGTP